MCGLQAGMHLGFSSYELQLCASLFPCVSLLVSDYKKPTLPPSHFPQNSWSCCMAQRPPSAEPKARLTPTPMHRSCCGHCGDRDPSGCKTLNFFHFCPCGGNVSSCSVLQQAQDVLLTLALGINLCRWVQRCDFRCSPPSPGGCFGA